VYALEFWVATITIVVGCLTAWTLYKDFFQDPDIHIYSGDSIDIVKSTDLTCKKVQIAITLVNKARKYGVVNCLLLDVLPDEQRNAAMQFRWNMFYEYAQGHNSVPTSKVCPIGVPGNNMTFRGVQFENEKGVNWTKGGYTFQVSGWLERKSPAETPDISDKFHVVLSEEYITQLKRSPITGNSPELHTVMIDNRS
jgi:hypothetical protein